MKLINYEMSGVVEFMKKLFEIDKSFIKNTNGPDDRKDRVVLGANAGSILSTVSMSFKFKEAIFFDIETMKNIATSVDVVNGCLYSTNPTPFDTIELEKTVPDVFNYLKELSGLSSEFIAGENKQDDIFLLYPIGGFKFTIVVNFSGKDIITLFNGFLETYIYTTFNSIDDFSDIEKVEGMIKTETFKNLMTMVSKVSYQASHKPSLIEDYMIQKEYYNFIKNTTSQKEFSLAEILYGTDKIRFYGVSNPMEIKAKVQKFELSTIDKVNGDIGTTSKYNTQFTIGINSNILIFMVLKLFGKGFRIIANEKYDILFSRNNDEFLMQLDDIAKYSTRINSILSHNIQCRNIVINDVKTSTNLSDPSIRYGFIPTGYHIKYLIQFSVNNINNLDIMMSQLPKNLTSQAYDLISSIKHLARSVERQYLKLIK